MIRITEKRKVLLLTVVLVATVFICTEPSSALLALPDVGIDYRTLTVVDAAKLKAAGMRDAKNGDRVSLGRSPDGGLQITNMRNGETLQNPRGLRAR